MAAAPAHAQVDCLVGNPPPGQIYVNDDDNIVCDNDDARDFAGNVIDLRTYNGNYFTLVDNAGYLTGTNAAGPVRGIRAYAYDGDLITILNIGDITLNSSDDVAIAIGISALTNGGDSNIRIENNGAFDLTSTGVVAQLGYAYAVGIYAREYGSNSDISIENRGDFELTGSTAPGGYLSQIRGIDARTEGNDNSIVIENRGNFDITGTVTGPGGFASVRGIYARTAGSTSPILIENHGDFEITGAATAASVMGIEARTYGTASLLSIENHGDFEITSTSSAVDGNSIGILGMTNGTGSLIYIENSGDFVITSTGSPVGLPTAGILGLATYGDSPLYIGNSGDFVVTVGNGDGLIVAGVAGTSFSNDSEVRIINSGDVAVTAGGGNGVLAISLGARAGDPYTGIGSRSPIHIVNDGGDLITTVGNGIFARAHGVYARSVAEASPIYVASRNGDIVTTAGDGDMARAFGILAQTGALLTGTGGFSPVEIVNDSAVAATVGDGNDAIVLGIGVQTAGTSSFVDIVNNGDLAVTAGHGDFIMAFGIGVATLAYTGKGGGSPIGILNDGDIIVTAGNGIAHVAGIYAHTFGLDSSIDIVNHGDLVATAGRGDNSAVVGIHAIGGSDQFQNDGHPVSIVNSGDLAATAGNGDRAAVLGILAFTFGTGSPIDIVNSGGLAATVGHGTYASAYGMRAETDTDGGPIDITNDGDTVATAGNGDRAAATGILALAGGTGSPIGIENRGDIAATVGNGYGARAFGIGAQTDGDGNSIGIVNDADIAVTAGHGDSALAAGIVGASTNVQSPVDIVNRGDVAASAGTGADAQAIGVLALTIAPDSPIVIDNSGSVFGGTAGIATFSYTGTTTIVNSGFISAASLLAIDAGGAGTFFAPGIGRGAAAEILNTGHITGFVNMTNESDTFLNQAGGVFETKRVSDFFGGNDLFRNEAGGTILAATNPNVREHSAFTNLNRFESQGLITLQDGQVGDSFEISNTVGGRDSSFVASGNSALAVDAFLGPPGSTADNLIINGNVRGRTPLSVFNTNPGPGTLNTEGIPVVYVNGNVKSDAFFLTAPIDTGFFNYDLFFEPTNSGIFELRNFAGPGARVLPQIVTAAHDIWYLSASTWFDRTADLRVLLNGGAAPIAYDPTAGYTDGAPPAFTPAVWARGSGSWLDRDKSETVNAFGRTYRFNLDRELDIIDFQMGLDLGKRDLFSSNDILVFGMLGGFVHADLDYKQLNRDFDFSGGQVGGYATYLKGGLFVDTLLNVHLLDLETATLGFPSSLDVTTVGLRTDSGYRFGSFSGGTFIEPLATLLVTWADIDGFSLGGNTVSFDDNADVRGRLGVRVGTSTPVWGTTVLEPFVIGSLWGNLGDDNQATLTSTGTTFRFEDSHDGVWGEVSLGANLFTPSAGTAVFAKLDVIFGDDIDGLSGKAGMRVAW